MKRQLLWCLIAILACAFPALGQMQAYLSFEGNFDNTAGTTYTSTLNDKYYGETAFVDGAGFGQGVKFDCGTGYAAGDSLSFDFPLGEQGTFAMMMYVDNLFNYQGVFDNSCQKDDWECWIYGDGRIAWRVDGAKITYSLVNSGLMEQWFQFAVTWNKQLDGNVFQEMFINGVKVGEQTTAWVDPGTFNLGCNNSGNQCYNNYMDEFYAFDTVLTGEELKDLVPAGFDLIYPELGNPEVYSNATLTWEAPTDVPNPTYDVYLCATEPNFVSSTMVASNLTSPSYQVSNLVYGTEYFWKVYVRSNNGEKFVSSAISNFTANYMTGDFNFDEKVNPVDLQTVADNWLQDNIQVFPEDIVDDFEQYNTQLELEGTWSCGLNMTINPPEGPKVIASTGTGSITLVDDPAVADQGDKAISFFYDVSSPEDGDYEWIDIVCTLNQPVDLSYYDNLELRIYRPATNSHESQIYVKTLDSALHGEPRIGGEYGWYYADGSTVANPDEWVDWKIDLHSLSYYWWNGSDYTCLEEQTNTVGFIIGVINLPKTSYPDAQGTGTIILDNIRLTKNPICTAPQDGDLNDDCKVDMIDFAMMADNWMVVR